jgi:hypothetical protein
MSGGIMSNDSGLNKLKTAFERIKGGNTTVIPAGAKLTIRNVEAEAGMGDGSAYYYPELIDSIKAAKKDFKTHGRHSYSALSTSITAKNKDLAKRNEALVAQNTLILVAQAELSHNLFKNIGGEAISNGYNTTLASINQIKNK